MYLSVLIPATVILMALLGSFTHFQDWAKSRWLKAYREYTRKTNGPWRLRNKGADPTI